LHAIPFDGAGAPIPSWGGERTGVLPAVRVSRIAAALEPAEFDQTGIELIDVAGDSVNTTVLTATSKHQV